MLRPFVESARWTALLAASFVAGAATAFADDGDLSFSREVLPVLSKNCFACHGPDEENRQADLRLDDRETAVDFGAVVPGDPEASELIRRIFSADDSERMPPPSAHEALQPEEKELLRRWIAAGAEYAPHWAFVPPQRPEVPALSEDGWSRNPVDRFILQTLIEQGLSPSPEADRYSLIRRLSLDLTGLPPSPAQADAFVADGDPQAYEKLVDELLASPAYGERFGRSWLDLARYADTNGYEKDRPRSIWPYRDWVISALNADQPFDEFTIEQLAGDMLPKATIDQRIATGFHRNTMINEEGGIDPLEYRYLAIVDRVATTGTVWLGLTTGCAQCHTHKYDPITHTDYFRLFALLNNADEADLLTPDEAVLAERSQRLARIDELEAALADQFPPAAQSGGGLNEDELRRQRLDSRFADWLTAERERSARWTVLRPTAMESNLPRLELLPDGSIFSSGDITKRDVFTLAFPLADFDGPVTALRLEALPDDRLPGRGPGRCYYEGRQGDFFLSEFTAQHDGQPAKLHAASHSYGKISVGSGSADAANVIDGDGSTGWSTAEREGQSHQLVVNFAEPLPPQGELRITLLFERHFAASLGRFRISATTKPGTAVAGTISVELEDALAATDGSELPEAARDPLLRHFLRTAPELAEARKPIDELRKQIPELTSTMTLLERPADNPRTTQRHHRGEYLNAEETVSPGVPAIFPQLPDDAPADRLALARWLVSERNPLAARVTADRAWRTLMGDGLVRTNGDFGTQSDPPTHPELLDWLACELVAEGWSLKRLHRLLVTSSTYRQRSDATAERLRRDPENRYWARASRHRVDAEIVRDIMLAASGALSEKMFGPSVFPPQPKAVVALGYGGFSWNESSGEDRYRRSLYTFTKRTTPFAAYTAFDGPTGENCIAVRDRSNTPLQALTLLNDEMFLELARALGKRTAALESRRLPDRVEFVFRRLLTRPPTAGEREQLMNFARTQRERLRQGELNPAQIAGTKSATPEEATWVMVARVLMNLDETIARP